MLGTCLAMGGSVTLLKTFSTCVHIRGAGPAGKPAACCRRLVALHSTEISKPFATCCVFEVQRPYCAEDTALGGELTVHKKCRLRHVGTGMFLKLDTTNNESPVFLEHPRLIDPSRPQLGHRNDSQMVFSVLPRLKSHTSPEIR